MKEIKVSVIVPTYNSEQVVGRCLDSLLNQTLQEIEIICVDDGSTDATRDILMQQQREHPNKVKVVAGVHQGVFASRNLGIMLSEGEYIGFCDADDYALPTMYEEMYHQIIQEDADIAICAYRRLSGRSAQIEMNHLGRTTYEIKKHMDILPVINTAIWNKLIRRELALVEANFEKNPRVAEDMMYMLHVYAKSEKITFVNVPLYEYIVGKESAMTYVLEREMIDIMNAMVKTKNNILLRVNEKKQWKNVMALFAMIHLGVSLPLRLETKGLFDFCQKGMRIWEWMSEEFPEWRNNIYVSSKNLYKVRMLVGFEKSHVLNILIYLYRKMPIKIGMIGW